jgi:hypothetical protein
MGVHQKIDRVAHRHLLARLPKRAVFPSLHDILHFEGLNGPDGIKRKSPGKDEPWHYIDPNDADDREIFAMISDHIYNMGKALREKNHERAAFEAAWMAHAITDGLTPAHHFPLEAKLEELRDGQGLETRTTTKEKLVLPGKTRRHQIRNNWEFWGAKGIMTTHLAFELGVATGIAPLRFEEAVPDQAMYKRITNLSEVAAMNMYEEFGKLGWTRHLAQEARNILMPNIIKAVILGWYKAYLISKEDE